MRHSRPITLRNDIRVLFGPGTLAGASDGELLTVFLQEGRDAGGLAFEELVNRHGPMVHRVCYHVARDRHEAEDAAQAVFLILARRAGQVKNRASVGSWLYGVALRVAARVRNRRRHRIDREATLAGDHARPYATGPVEGVLTSDTAQAIHEEVGRLTESFRAPIVLCYLEGLTHDQAAARLDLPVGTVRSRLARGRQQLRGRLDRRGLGELGALGPLLGWFGFDPAIGAAARTVPLAAWGAQTVSPRAITTAIYATRLAGRVSATGLSVCSTASVTLAREVLWNMLLQRTVLLGGLLVPVGLLVVSAGLVLGQAPAGPGTKPPQAASLAERSQVPVKAYPKPPSGADPLVQQLLEAARRRLDAQRAYYEEGRITIDRFVAACDRLREVEELVATTEEDRFKAMEKHVAALRGIEEREQAELTVGKGTIADLAEITQNRLEAEVRLSKARQTRSAPDMAALERRLVEVERKLDLLLKARNDQPRTKR